MTSIKTCYMDNFEIKIVQILLDRSVMIAMAWWIFLIKAWSALCMTRKHIESFGTIEMQGMFGTKVISVTTRIIIPLANIALLIFFFKSKYLYINQTKKEGNKHCVKSAQIRSFFWSVFSRIRTEYGKLRTRKNSVFEW